MLITRKFISHKHSPSSSSVLLRCQSRVLLGVDSHQSQENSDKGGISKIILNSFEWMSFGNQRSHFSIFTNVFHYLMKSGWDDGIEVNPRSSQQQIGRGVSINDLTCHLEFQVPNLTPELDFSYRARIIGVEVIYDCLRST